MQERISKKHFDYLMNNIEEFKQTEDTFSKQAALVNNALALFDNSPQADFLKKAAECFSIISKTKAIWEPFFNAKNLPEPDFFIQLNQTLGTKGLNRQFIERFTACGWLVKNYSDLHAILMDEMKHDKPLKARVDKTLRQSGCNLSLDALLITPIQRLTRYPLFANEWSKKLNTLPDDSPYKQNAFSLFRKFKRMAAAMNGIEKAASFQKEQKKNQDWSDILFDYFTPKEDLVGDPVVVSAFTNAMEQSFVIASTRDDKELVEEAFQDSQQMNSIITREDRVLLQNLEDLGNSMRKASIKSAFRTLYQDLTGESGVVTLSPEDFKASIKKYELSSFSESEFNDILSLIDLARQYLKNPDAEAKDFIAEVSRLEGKYIVVSPEKATACVIIAVCTLVTAAILFGIASGGIGLLATAAVFGFISLVTMAAGAYEAKKTFYPEKTGFFAICHEAKLIPEEGKVERKTINRSSIHLPEIPSFEGGF